MREILFRAKRLDNGEWVEGDYCNCMWQANKEIKVPCIYAWDKHALMGLTVKIDPATLGQFTGLSDKNGKKIFEGDVVHVLEVHSNKTNEYSSSIFWDSGEFMLKESENVDVPISCYFADIKHQMNPLHEIEVIGNIHDNPELLEVKP